VVFGKVPLSVYVTFVVKSDPRGWLPPNARRIPEGGHCGGLARPTAVNEGKGRAQIGGRRAGLTASRPGVA
jgi:hypothetical protein